MAMPRGVQPTKIWAAMVGSISRSSAGLDAYPANLVSARSLHVYEQPDCTSSGLGDDAME